MPRGGARPGAGRKSLTDEEKLMRIKTLFALALLNLISIEELASIVANKCRKGDLKAVEIARNIISEGLSNNNDNKNNININQVIIERKIIDTSVEN